MYKAAKPRIPKLTNMPKILNQQPHCLSATLLYKNIVATTSTSPEAACAACKSLFSNISLVVLCISYLDINGNAEVGVF